MCFCKRFVYVCQQNTRMWTCAICTYECLCVRACIVRACVRAFVRVYVNTNVVQLTVGAPLNVL